VFFLGRETSGGTRLFRFLEELALFESEVPYMNWLWILFWLEKSSAPLGSSRSASFYLAGVPLAPPPAAELKKEQFELEF
jgi:hypothetical protein